MTDRRRTDGLHFEELHELRYVVANVGDVVDLAGETNDVLAVERRDEGLVQMSHDLVVELVSVVLDRMDVSDLVLDLGEVAEELR